MGICSSCLGSRDGSDEAERRALLDDPYAQTHNTFLAWNQPPPSQPNALNPDEQRREQQAMHNILSWASDQIVEIFPVNAHQQAQQVHSSITLPESDDGDSSDMTQSQHQDILLSMIPGDKTKRSIRIYPASRPGTADAQSVRSKASLAKLNGSTRSGRGKESVFVKLNVDTD